MYIQGYNTDWYSVSDMVSDTPDSVQRDTANAHYYSSTFDSFLLLVVGFFKCALCLASSATSQGVCFRCGPWLGDPAAPIEAAPWA